MAFLTIPVVVALCACINTFAGGRFIADEKLPGRNLYYAAPLMFLSALLVVSWPVALAWAVGYLFWRSFAWGHLIGMGRFNPTDRPPSPVEAFCLNVAAGNVPLAMLVREFAAAPAFVLVAGLIGAPLFALSILAYALLGSFVRDMAWEYASPDAAIMYGEIGEGALWGTAICLSAWQV